MNSNVDEDMPAVNPGPLLLMNAIYSQEQVIQALKVTQRTLERWQMAGLTPLKPATSQVYYYSNDILEVMRKPADEIPEYRAKYKRKPNTKKQE